MEDYVFRISEEPPALELFLKRYRESSAKLVFYGAGSGAARFAKMLEHYGIQPDFICDSDPAKLGSPCFGKKICRMEDVLAAYANVLTVVTSVVYQGEIRARLVNELKIADGDVYYFPVPWTLDRLLAEKQLFLKNMNQLARVTSHLADERSREVLNQVINGRITGNQQYFLNVFEGAQYFCPDLIRLGRDEVFIDGGAFTGDTIDDFIRYSQGVFSKIIAFEPEANAYRKLEKSCEARKDPRIQICRKGLYSDLREIGFDDVNAGSGGACIADNGESGEESIFTETIDHLGEEQVSFIKLDIEGSELQALKGAECTIKKCRPKLAVCLYHKPEDFLEIPLYILSLDMNYRLYIRHHSDLVNETVLYAL